MIVLQFAFYALSLSIWRMSDSHQVQWNFPSGTNMMGMKTMNSVFCFVITFFGVKDMRDGKEEKFDVRDRLLNISKYTSSDEVLFFFSILLYIRYALFALVLQV